MRKVPVDLVKPGMYLARSIIDSEGVVLLRAGVELDELYLNRLRSLGIRNIYVRDENFGDTDEVEDVISEETRINTVRMVKKTFSQLQNQRKINTAALRQTVNNLLDEILDNANVLVSVSTISALDDYIFFHSVSVCTLSILTGITLGYSESTLRELGIGALLHDIGKAEIEPDILKREGALNEEEAEILATHTTKGYQILRGYSDIPLLSAHVAFQHHERWDGKGYPRQLAGTKITEFARIVAVANFYDNLVADLPNRPSYEVNQAINLIKRLAGSYFDPKIASITTSHIASYPVGTIVMLNTGDIGMVVRVSPDSPHRPQVRILFNKYLQRLEKQHEVDLSGLSTIFIQHVLSEIELDRMLNSVVNR